MARDDQSDLFASNSDLFDDDAPTPVYRADPDEVRAELYKILAEARAAKTLPWEAETGFALQNHLSADDELASRG
jgi:hypothetical protein